MPMRVVGLGHVGIYVRDLARMSAFYRDFIGMTLTKTNDSSAFFSSDPGRSDHEIVMMLGRPSAEDPHLINQISMRVPTLNDLREFHRRLISEKYRIHRVVTHVSAIGCYFDDPEGNTTELFWLTGLPSWVPIGIDIEIERPDSEIMADVHRYWEKVRHVQVGEKADANTRAVIRDLTSREAIKER
ncbi:MAG: VOC family protein [Burkholderiales bacterium]